MTVNFKQLSSYIYKKYGGKLKIVHIFDNSIANSNFNLNGEMVISRNVAHMLARIFIAAAPVMMHPDIEFNSPNRE